MQVYRSALSACVMKNLPNVEYYMPLDRDRLEEGRKNIVRNNRPNNNNDTDRVDNESVNTVATQVDINQVDDDDNVIIID
jgi:hypothetical protein